MDGAGLPVTVLLPPARENVELTTLYLLTPGNGCKKVSSAFCLSCIPPLGYREIRLFSSLLLARLFFPPPPPPPFPSFLPRNSLPSSLFLFRFFFLSGRRGGGTRGRSSPPFFFIPLEPLKAKFQRFQKEASELHALSDFDTFHLPSPLPLPAKGRTAGSLSVASSN